MTTTIDGMVKGRDGSLFSFSYDLWDGRVVRVSFFDHKPHSEFKTEWFTFGKGA